MQRLTTVTGSILILMLLLLSCNDNDAALPDDEIHQDDIYEVKGRYLSTDMRGESISVVHEEIPDVMNAMRMSLRISDPSDAEELETGDVIRFEMVRTESGWFAREIEVLPPDTELDLPDDLHGVGVE
ncbi:copper-binding protein [Natronogracilivirga saccharolytica]|uniref:Copper-binding protein n=1 Tax=Natronogracilivirga saccharolytica TaxID=2812953 RepID=A0A8J7UW94_9BACT|nr:copper-binding protein [Natronogracilivirga saccharolytica]MBP3193426.1 copper-binding protein [Natronogracilivirga saccharolytica]